MIIMLYSALQVQLYKYLENLVVHSYFSAFWGNYTKYVQLISTQRVNTADMKHTSSVVLIFMHALTAAEGAIQ